MLREGALDGQVIVITGGGTGLGRSMAEAFLRLGAQVCITSRKMEVLEATAAEMEKATGGTVLPVACDVRKWQDVDHLVEEVMMKFGKVDGLVNNAAGNFISPTERLSSKAFETIIGIVLMGTVNCTLAFGKHWIAKGEKEKRVLNITTTYAWTGSGYVVPSACAKAGVLALTRSLAVEWAKYGIRTNAGNHWFGCCTIGGSVYLPANVVSAVTSRILMSYELGLLIAITTSTVGPAPGSG